MVNYGNGNPTENCFPTTYPSILHPSLGAGSGAGSLFIPVLCMCFETLITYHDVFLNWILYLINLILMPLILYLTLYLFNALIEIKITSFKIKLNSLKI
jgi:hypothetical protein